MSAGGRGNVAVFHIACPIVSSPALPCPTRLSLGTLLPRIEYTLLETLYLDLLLRITGSQPPKEWK